MAKGMQAMVTTLTSGASGIGRVTAQVFAREGAKVVETIDAKPQGIIMKSPLSSPTVLRKSRAYGKPLHAPYPLEAYHHLLTALSTKVSAQDD
jgi:hypothetical protein